MTDQDWQTLQSHRPSAPVPTYRVPEYMHLVEPIFNGKCIKDYRPNHIPAINLRLKLTFLAYAYDTQVFTMEHVATLRIRAYFFLYILILVAQQNQKQTYQTGQCVLNSAAAVTELLI